MDLEVIRFRILVLTRDIVSTSWIILPLSVTRKYKCRMHACIGATLVIPLTVHRKRRNDQDQQ